MPNLHVQARLEGIQKILNGAYHANSTMSSASKGAERAAFIDGDRYESLNDPTFLAYGGREYDAFRIEAFWEDGSRFPDEQLVANIVRQTAGFRRYRRWGSGVGFCKSVHTASMITIEQSSGCTRLPPPHDSSSLSFPRHNPNEFLMPMPQLR
jgi:hypothetical protein